MRRPDTQSVITKIQNQLEKKDISRRLSKDIKKLPTKPANSYAASFINSQLRNRSFDTGNVSQSFVSRHSNDQRRQSKDKLHQSFSHLKQQDEIKNKSTYFTELSQQEPKKQKNIKLSQYFQKCGELMNKVSSKQQNPPKLPTNIISQFQDFKIQDISSLITLIDTCVQEANSYISDLTIKIQRLIQQSQEYKKIIRRLEQMNKTHLIVIKEKQDQLNRLGKNKSVSKNQDLKSFVKVIDQLNQQNTLLKQQIDILRGQQTRNATSSFISAAKKKDIYNTINRNIEVLNISLNKTEGESNQTNNAPQSITDVNQQQYYPKSIGQRTTNSAGKKYKYIKPKSMSFM